MRGEPTISPRQEFCVRRFMFYQTFCLSFFYPDPYLWALHKTHNSFCIKQELSISQPPSFLFFFHGGLNARTTKLSSPLPTPPALKAEIWWIRWNSAQNYRAWWYFVWPICISLIWSHDKEHESSLSSAASVSTFVGRSLHRVQNRQYQCALLTLQQSLKILDR